MRKFTFLLLCCAFITLSFAQNNPRPTKSRFWNSNRSTFLLKHGDILLYEVEEDGQKYNFIATIKQFGESASFSYSIPEKGKTGKVTTPANALKSGVHYYNLFDSTAQKQKDRNTLWLSKENFRGLATDSNQTRLDFGIGQQTFTRIKTATQKIKYKGKERIITIYKVTGTGGPFTEMWVMNEINNPLITGFKGSQTITLKEVR